MNLSALSDRRAWLGSATVLTLGAAMLAWSPAAHADPTSFDPKTSVVATRLPLVGNAGRIPLQVVTGNDDVVGFVIDVPAGAGSWVTAKDLAEPLLGIHCKGTAGAALHYVCGQSGTDWDNGNHLVSRGSYQISLPAQRTGAYAGLIGTITLVKIDAYGESFLQDSDTFPVVNGAVGPRSNAEVRNLSGTSPDQTPGNRTIGDLAVTVTVVGGESRTTGLDLTLPQPDEHWTLTGTTGGGHLTCASTSDTAIHCTNTVAGQVLPFPTGVFTAVLHLYADVDEYSGGAGISGTAALDYADGTSQIPDTFDQFYNYVY